MTSGSNDTHILPGSGQQPLQTPWDAHEGKR